MGCWGLSVKLEKFYKSLSRKSYTFLVKSIIRKCQLCLRSTTGNSDE